MTKRLAALLCALLLLAGCSAPAEREIDLSSAMEPSVSSAMEPVAAEDSALLPEAPEVTPMAPPEAPPETLPETPPAEAALPGFERAWVVRAVDGDTLVLRYEGREERLRLIGVDTPETHHPTKPVQYFGPEAASYTASVLTPGREVWLERDSSDRDRYGRLLRYLWLTPPSAAPSREEIAAGMFNAQLVANGYAVPVAYAPDLRYIGLFRDLAETSRREGWGVWGAPAGAPSNLPERRWQARQASPAPEGAVRGNRRSKIYHLPGQQGYDKIAPGNIVVFESPEAAEAAGYRAARR